MFGGGIVLGHMPAKPQGEAGRSRIGQGSRKPSLPSRQVITPESLLSAARASSPSSEGSCGDQSSSLGNAQDGAWHRCLWEGPDPKLSRLKDFKSYRCCCYCCCFYYGHCLLSTSYQSSSVLGT